MISVIVPAYNAERTLARTLDSLAVQTFDAYEVVVVNDGSLDGTEEVALSYASRNPRFRYFSQAENLGTGPAVNRGVGEAIHDYLVVVAADDEATPDLLSELASDAQEYPEFDIWARNLLYVFPAGYTSPAFSWVEPRSLTLADLLTGGVIPGGGTLFTRRLHRAIGGRSEQRLADDVEFFARALLAGFRHRWAPGLHYLYWQELDRKGADWVAEMGTRIQSTQRFIDSGTLTHDERSAAEEWIEKTEQAILEMEERARFLEGQQRLAVRIAWRERNRRYVTWALPLYRILKAASRYVRPDSDTDPS